MKSKASSKPATSRCTMEEKASRYYYYLYTKRDKRCQFPGKKLISRATVECSSLSPFPNTLSQMKERKCWSFYCQQESKQTGIECGPSSTAPATENVYVLF